MGCKWLTGVLATRGAAGGGVGDGASAGGDRDSLSQQHADHDQDGRWTRHRV